ncbi:MAG TPA: hypothetical protein VKB93_09870 [Thermoanaerobaculia bacterium]|nr:hypothetical protein [Thermoanaerobaculia bacterium]
MQFGIFLQCAAQTENRAVPPALLGAPVLLRVRNERPTIAAVLAVMLPMSVRVIADEPFRQNRAHVLQRLLRRHAFGDRFTPAHEVTQLVTAPPVEHDVAQLHVAEKIGRRLDRIFHACLDVNRAPMRALPGRLRPSREHPVRRRKNAPDHVPQLVVSHKAKSPFGVCMAEGAREARDSQ